jgi:protein tyrosine phosphatase
MACSCFKNVNYLVNTIIITIAVGLLLWCLWDDNIHTLIRGQYYRSSQLSPYQLNRFIQKNHIRSVFNLRGVNPYNWYRDEAAMTKHDHIILYNTRLSALRLPPPSQLRQIATILKTGAKPMVIHCASGIDRTGLVSAMIYLIDGRTLTQAWYQTSWHYGAVRSRSAGKQMLRAYQNWLTQHGYHESTAALFQRWLAR